MTTLTPPPVDSAPVSPAPPSPRPPRRTASRVVAILVISLGSVLLLGALTTGALTTVFAGQDVDAVQRARSYFTGYPPSSPSIGLLRNGRLVFMLERHQIEGRSAQEIARDLTGAFDKYCAASTPAAAVPSPS